MCLKVLTFLTLAISILLSKVGNGSQKKPSDQTSYLSEVLLVLNALRRNIFVLRFSVLNGGDRDLRLE